MRTALSLGLAAAAVAAGLATTAPRAAAQSAERPAVAETDLDASDAANMRLLVGEEAVHRNHLARLARLRALAERNGHRERLAELERLEDLENQRFEARRLHARSRMSEPALRQADEFLARGGVMKMRRANQAQGGAAERGRRAQQGAERAQPQRRTGTTSTRPGATRTGTSGRGRSGSGGRSPR